MTLGSWLDTLVFHAGLHNARYHVGIRGGRWLILSKDDYLPDAPLADILDSPDLVVYPTDLILPLAHVNWFWWIDEREVRLGTAWQTFAYVRGDCTRAWAAPADDVHGACVWDGYGMRQARAYPAWCGY